MPAQAKRIVILGGGFAGTAVAVRLEHLFKHDPQVEITLVDRENFSVFTPLLPEVPSGAIEAKHVVSPLRALLRRTAVKQAEVHAIDTAKRIVLAGHCPACHIYPLEYDHLVLALGAVTNFFGLPGVGENALTMKSLADAASLHAHTIGHFEHADLESDSEIRRELLTFVVAGGGFAGVETAAELNDFVRSAGRFYSTLRAHEARVVIVHPGPRILPEVSESLSAYALEVLRRRGVEVRLQSRIESYKDNRVRLTTGEEIATRTLIWTAGVLANPLLAKLDVPRNQSGRVEVDATLRVRDRPGIWAMGDCAAAIEASSGKPCPPTAQFALRQGRRVAENIAAVIRGSAPQPFRFKPLGLLASLGRRSAVAEVFGLKFSGFPAWWLWRSIYLMKLPGFERKLRVVIDWTLDLFFSRDIVYLRPTHLAHGSEAVSETKDLSASS